MITVRVYADEVVLRLDQLPRRVRAAAHGKLEDIVAQLREKLFVGMPNKYFPRDTTTSGIADIGSIVSGYLEVEEKTGTYPIIPKTKPFLQFIAKDGDWVRTKHVNHPFLKVAPSVARLLEESKPWIVDQLEDAIIEAL